MLPENPVPLLSVHRPHGCRELLFLNSMKFVGGGETWMVRIASLLAERGNKVTLVARSRSPLAAHAHKAGIPLVALHMGGDMNPILLWKLSRILRASSTDVVVANTARDVRLAAFARAIANRPSVRVVGLHQVDKPMPNRWNYRLTFTRFVDGMVVNSLSTKATLKDHNSWLANQLIEVIPHGIEPAAYSAPNSQSLKAELGIPESALVVGFVGRLSGQKGISVLLPAMETVLRARPDVHLVIVGTGTLEAKVNRFAKSECLGGRVHVLGFRKDVPGLMGQFDLLLVPSLWEGFGLVLIEAMAAGTPCVASSISSIPEIVDDGMTGILVPPGSADELADAALRLIDDPVLRLRLGESGRAKVMADFTNEKMVAHYEALFDILIKGAGKDESARRGGG